MGNKKVIIIGSGLAGLSAGIELQKKGLNTEIYELAPWAGGVCTSWVRKGYRFDGCIHWMVGTNPKSGYFDLYKRVKALEDDTVCYHPEEIYLEHDDEKYVVPLELDAFIELLLDLSPEDKKTIYELKKAITLFLSSKMPSGKPNNIFGLLAFPFKYHGFFKLIIKYGKKTVGDFIKKIQSEKVRYIIKSLMSEPFSIFALIMMLGMRFTKNGGYPEGGSLDVIKRMESYYKELGGSIHFNSEVTELIREDKQITGVKVGNKIIKADAVISAGDAHNLLHELLKDPSLHPELNDLLQDDKLLFPAISLVSFGLKKQLGIPYTISFETSKEMFKIGDTVVKSLTVRSFDFDKTAAPTGRSSVMVLLNGSLSYWQDLRKKDLEAYNKEKALLADKVASYLDIKYPSFKESIEVVDVSTPATYVRLANLYKASFEGFLPLPGLVSKNIKRTLDGIDNLVLCGQWVTPGGGIPPAIGSGIDAASMIEKILSDENE